MTELLDGSNIHCITIPTPFAIGPVNVYLVLGDPPLLIDTGPNTPEAYEQLVAALKNYGIAIADIGVILLTHGHLDHIGLLARLLEESTAVSYAHPHAVDRSSRYESETELNAQFYLEVMTECGVPSEVIEAILANRNTFKSYGAQVNIHHQFEDRGRVGDYEVHFAPGHSASDVVFFDVKSRFAFVGDHLLTTMNPNPLLRRPKPGMPRAKSLLEFHASLRRTRKLDIAVVCPGHGRPFGNHRGAIDSLLSKNEQRTQRVKTMLAETTLTPFEVAQRLFPKIDFGSLYLGLSVAVGHIEILEDRGEIEVNRENGVMTCKLAS